MEAFEHLLYQLYLSYFQARKNKRNTHNQLRFEIYQEEGLMQLAKDIYQRKYTPKPCIAFIIHKPVMREIFAADFTDRIVHHLLYRCIYPIFDRKLINDTYSCRVGKGTLFGINRVKHFICSCSENYIKPTFILKLDVQAYFMNMQHQIIYDKVVAMLPQQKQNYLGISTDTVLYLLRQTIFNAVAQNCRIKGSRNDWNGLPASKSLFHYPANTGLPIGNLTSQVFGNVYLNDFDHFVKHNLKIKHYGRYVDDMIFVHNDKDYLLQIIPQLQAEMNKVGLTIHPNKIVLADAKEGIPFLGQIIKPYRNLVSNRTKNNFYQAILKINQILAEVPLFDWKQLCDIRATLNSYLLLDGGIQAQAVSRQCVVLRRVKRYVQLPVAGNRNNSNGSLNNVGSNGNYWSSTVDGTNSRNLNFNSSDANMNSNNRANGNSVRCLKDCTLHNSATSLDSFSIQFIQIIQIGL